MKWQEWPTTEVGRKREQEWETKNLFSAKIEKMAMQWAVGIEMGHWASETELET
jgi:hypothetical protein